MNPVQAAKSTAARALAWSLHSGLRVLRSNRGPLTADEWRKVQFSYSQFGEDLVVLNWFRRNTAEGGQSGTYVDVGAFHPVQWSNTLLLHKLGWRGVNVDANPRAIQAFAAHRPKDANVVAAVASTSGEMTYSEYPHDATNRLVGAGESMKSVLGEDPIRTTPVRVRTLTSILDEHLAAGTRVDFLSIDCEGHDIEVLRGLDFRRYRPVVVAIEAHDDASANAIAELLQPHGLRVAARVGLTWIFARAA
jgi:FkbM family methyltransferase